jgi:hypothetical protein
LKSRSNSAALIAFLVSFALAGFAADVTAIRDQILAAYQHSIDALRRGDADAALSMDTDDWTSTTVGQPPRTKQEMEPFIRHDITSLKPPDNWKVVWLPDAQRRGTVTGIQLYDLKVDGQSATVLCLVGSAREQSNHTVWTGSHVRDTWTQTAAGWKRRKHEKLTVNERLLDGKPIG